MKEAAIDIDAELVRLFVAEEAAGCGFYDDPDWTRSYDKLRNHMGRKSRFFHPEESKNLIDA